MVCNIGLSAFPDFDHHKRAKCREYQGQILSIVAEVEDRRNRATATLLHRVGVFPMQDGKVREGHNLLVMAFSYAKEAFGEEHPDTLTTMNNLALSYGSLGRTKEAAELQEKVLEARRRILGEEHPDTLTTMNDLALSYHSLGRTKEAAELQEKVLEARRRILGEEHPHIADDDE